MSAERTFFFFFSSYVYENNILEATEETAKSESMLNSSQRIFFILFI